MELVDENEGYDSEDDANEECKDVSSRATPSVIEFLKADEVPKFSLAPPTRGTKAKEIPDDVPAFWLGNPTTNSSQGKAPKSSSNATSMQSSGG